MHISWNYLDKRKATIDAIESYDDMVFIIDHTDEEIVKLTDRMVGVGSPGMDGLPHAHDPKAGENRLINTIDEIDVLKERYRQAKEYMDWFKPAWEKLAEDERFVLSACFMEPLNSEDSMRIVSRHFNIERTSVYMKKKRALDHMTALLYGKC